jgi:hypothetical protein
VNIWYIKAEMASYESSRLSFKEPACVDKHFFIFFKLNS